MRFPGSRSLAASLACVAILAAAPSVAAAQSMDGVGLVPTGLLLRQMDGVKRVLMIGAHPDDEDTSFLTALARGWGVETAYLSLTRGDGGQNLIGPELWEGLGVIRTGELEAARRLDGGRQFFTRAFDYGYSKSADEALSLWPREDLLRDVTWVVRRFRPQVIVSVWSGTPADGHGQHQAAGIMAREVFEVAGDPARFPDQLGLGVEAWQPLKLYVSARRFGPGGVAPEGAIVVPTGDMDPLLGRSLYQLSMESRSQHRSQDMGAARALGPRQTGVRLVASRVGDGEGLFAGVDTTLAGTLTALGPEALAAAGPYLEAYREAVGRARAGLGLDPGAIVPALAEAHDELVSARRAIGDAANVEFDVAMTEKQRVVSRALMAASGIVFDVRADDDLLVPGQTVQVEARLWNGGPTDILTPGIQFVSRAGWRMQMTSMEGMGPGGGVPAGTMATWTYDLTIPQDAEVSRLYFLRQARDGARYRWPDEPALWSLPRDPPPIEWGLTFRQGVGGEQLGSRIVVNTHWRYVGVDPAFGQYDKEILVVPALSVDVQPRGLVWPAGRSEASPVTVVVRSQDDAGVRGTLSVEAPPGWTASPARLPFELGGAGAERALSFEVRPDDGAQAGDHTFRVSATTDDGRTYDEGLALIDYDHVPRSPLYGDAEATVTVVPVAARPGLSVGYVMGSGDEGPEAIRQMGVDVELLDEERVRAGDFGRFDAIVLAVRAYEVRPDLQGAAGPLLDFARAGGTVLIQYNRAPLGALAPAPIQIGRGSPRVADETRPITVLEPEAPIFTTPNRITEADFDGWVQERGLYFAAEWDDAWVPLLELNDPGEEPRRGSMLVTTVGDGVVVYTALSFFRQWADRVPGAYRLFANLISLDAGDWRAFQSR